ncbi:glycerophosphodiester phosphodiesterase family protein [Enterococcus gallinarum]|uniref:glycerophosphodiester phosphodiesterase family protein n=1 Tax=Enterococcus gallinarum TaxID=1353 RepID=UPI001F03CC5B|nr:glycerophosphodiester phosphodiesterase family protein [Enterococcus gallinarum]
MITKSYELREKAVKYIDEYADGVKGSADKAIKANNAIIDSIQATIDKEYERKKKNAESVDNQGIQDSLKQQAENDKKYGEQLADQAKKRVDRINKILSDASKNSRELSDQERAYIEANYNQLSDKQLKLAGFTSEQRIAIESAYQDKLSKLTDRQLEDRANSVGKALNTEQEKYEQNRKAIIEGTKDNVQRQKALLEELDKEHKNSSESMILGLAKLRLEQGYSLEQMSSVWQQYGWTVDEVADLVNSSVDDTTKNLDMLAKGTEEADIQWNQMALDPKTGEVRTTSAWYLVFNLSTKAITVIPYSTLGNYVKGYAILGSLRIMGVINGVSQFSLFLPYPFLVDGKLYGYSSDEGSKNISISLDAPVKCIHHRGYSLKYPENTLLAYKKSKSIGVNEVEMDLSWTVDNIPVNLHDETINRTARDSEGNPPSTDIKISEITLAQAREYEYGSWKGAEFKGEKLPTFEDCVIQCKAFNQRLHVDRAFLLTEDKLEILDTILTKYDFYNIVWYINSKTSGDLIRAKYPNATLAYLLFSDVTQGAIDVCKQLNLEAAKCIVFPQADLITEVNVDLALSENIEVHVWNADNLNRYTLISMGVSGISTDFANIQEELL